MPILPPIFRASANSADALLLNCFGMSMKASVLVGIGLLLVYARGALARFSVGGGLATRLLPAASALVILVAGLAITLQAVPRLL